MLKHRIKTAWIKAFAFFKRHRGEITYYLCVFAALGLIAWSAEQYRANHREAQPASLPAVEIAQSEPEPPAFILPEGMALRNPCSLQPVWNENNRSWQAHPAADYLCAEGNVYSLSAGEVKNVGESGVLGGFIEVQRGDVLLKYCSVLPDERITPGAQIEQGTVLGRAQNAMPGEMHLGDHLHLEAYRDDHPVDPETLLACAD